MQNTSVVPAAEIGLDDAGIVADGLRRALGDLLAEVQHGHAGGADSGARGSAATRTLSRTEISGKMLVIWNVLGRPRRFTPSGGNPVMSSPQKRTVPADGACSPDTTLNRVDLPAPFGPITENTWPASTATLTRVSAASAPKRLETSATSRITPPRAPSAARRADAARAGPGA